MIGVRVYLSSGDDFYLDCSLDQAAALLFVKPEGLVEVGQRYVNPAQVAQLTVEQIPSIHSPMERLEGGGLMALSAQELLSGGFVRDSNDYRLVVTEALGGGSDQMQFASISTAASGSTQVVAADATRKINVVAVHGCRFGGGDGAVRVGRDADHWRDGIGCERCASLRVLVAETRCFRRR